MATTFAGWRPQRPNPEAEMAMRLLPQIASQFFAQKLRQPKEDEALAFKQRQMDEQEKYRDKQLAQRETSLKMEQQRLDDLKSYRAGIASLRKDQMAGEESKRVEREGTRQKERAEDIGRAEGRHRESMELRKKGQELTGRNIESLIQKRGETKPTDSSKQTRLGMAQIRSLQSLIKSMDDDDPRRPVMEARLRQLMKDTLGVDVPAPEPEPESDPVSTLNKWLGIVNMGATATMAPLAPSLIAAQYGIGKLQDWLGGGQDEQPTADVGRTEALGFMHQAKGDKDKARELARKARTK